MHHLVFTTKPSTLIKYSCIDCHNTMVGSQTNVRVNNNVDDIRRELVRRQSMMFGNEDIPQAMPAVNMDNVHITYSDQPTVFPEPPRLARHCGTMPLVVWHRGVGIIAAQIVLPDIVRWSRFQWACLNATAVYDGIDYDWTVPCGPHTWMAFVGDNSSDIVVENWNIVVCLGGCAYEATPHES